MKNENISIYLKFKIGNKTYYYDYIEDKLKDYYSIKRFGKTRNDFLQVNNIVNYGNYAVEISKLKILYSEHDAIKKMVNNFMGKISIMLKERYEKKVHSK